MPKPPSNTACSAPACDRTAIVIKPEPLCRRHYSRRRNGRPLVDERPAIGSPSGRGLYGVLDDDGDTVMCHECGRRVRAVGGHLTKAHDGMTAREYKLAHGLPLTRSLTSTAERERASQIALARVGSAAWHRLEAARDPAAASAARTAESFTAISRAPDLPERAVANGRKARIGRVYTCPVCAATWCRLPETQPRLCCTDDCARVWATTNPNKRRPRHAERDAAIYAGHLSGVSRQETAARWRITPVRVGQIVRAHQPPVS